MRFLTLCFSHGFGGTAERKPNLFGRRRLGTPSRFIKRLGLKVVIVFTDDLDTNRSRPSEGDAMRAHVVICVENDQSRTGTV